MTAVWLYLRLNTRGDAYFVKYSARFFFHSFDHSFVRSYIIRWNVQIHQRVHTTPAPQTSHEKNGIVTIATQHCASTQLHTYYTQIPCSWLIAVSVWAWVWCGACNLQLFGTFDIYPSWILWKYSIRFLLGGLAGMATIQIENDRAQIQPIWMWMNG